MRPGDSWAQAQPLRQLFDHLSDALLLLDRQARISFANTAALRSLPCETGAGVDSLRDALGDAAVQWVKRCIGEQVPGRALRSAMPSAPDSRLPDGRSVQLAWQPLDERSSALRLQFGPAAPAPGAAGEPTGIKVPALADLVQVLWRSPFPATLQDDAYRIVDANAAYVEFTGYAREQLIGIDPLQLQPEADRQGNRAARPRLLEEFHRQEVPPLIERRLIDASGRERWFRAARSALQDDQGRRLFLVVMQDSTAEHAARERADRSARELDDWFQLSPIGMVLFDEAGLLVRTNPAFEALAGDVPALMSDASPSLRQLLAWGQGAALPELQPGGSPLVGEGWVMQRDGKQRRLRSTVRCYHTPGGQRRFMAVVEDRSIEEERDIAQMQIGALIDTAGLGLATFQESSGWVRQRQASPAAGAPASAVLQSISRDIVLPESLPEYERLQQALRSGQRAQVRYAVRHPELGQRWLLTRVEPATLASGKQTTSVVTLDVSEQQRNLQRTEQLLHEMATILESSSAGIAYLRANVLVRCNSRFEAMLGLGGGGIAGSSVQELFGASVQGQRIAADTLQALSEGITYETEFEVPARPGSEPATRWYALSVRRSGPPGQASTAIEAIAVLSDITRLKTQQVELEMLARDRELMFSLSEVGIAFLRHGRLQRANDALAQLVGYSAVELAGLPLAQLFADPGEYEHAWAQQEHALRLLGRWTGERQLRRRDGSLLWVQVSKRLVEDGDVSGGIIASYVNVDDRHRAEQAVALQAERTRAILDSVLVGIVTVGARGIEWMNRSARRMFGGDLADFMDQPISTVATPEPSHPFRRTHYLDDLVEGEAETFECQVKARDGREFWVVGNAVATGREQGRQLTYALLDIERRRQAEARTAEAQASLQRIIEAAPMAITLRDARTLRILQVNDVAARSVERTPAEIIGCTPEEIFDPHIAVQRRRDMEQALGSRKLTQIEYRVDVDGETRVWDARYLPLASPGQPPDQLLLVATDVTEQRAVQEAKFEAALAQREMLVKEVHHRIKNNLQGVAGLLQQIAARKPEVAPAISEVVGQVQAIAQVYGLQVGVTGPLRLKSVVEAITGSVQRAFGHPIMLNVEGPSPQQWALPEAESIPIALCVNELLTNAVKHGVADRGLHVACTLVCGDDGARVRIANRATLPSGFNLARFPGGMSGLGLVRSLLPRRSASLDIEQQGDQVVATVSLSPPGIRKLEPM
jgi:PAS domain S-box-containing protein